MRPALRRLALGLGGALLALASAACAAGPAALVAPDRGTAQEASGGNLGVADDQRPADVPARAAGRAGATVAGDQAAARDLALARDLVRARRADAELAALVRAAEAAAEQRAAALRRERRLARAYADQPFSFDLTSLNILGSNHTSPGSDADHFAPGTIRTEWAVSFLERRGSDVIGFQEIQRDQLAVFMRATRGQFGVWPGTALGGVGVPQSLVWRESMFEAVEKSSVTIPFMNQQRPQPVVLLRHRETGREFWVINVHNAPRDREAEREKAEEIEIKKIQELRATGTPVFFIGDMNEKAEIFCEVTGRTDLYSPLGGSNDGSCNPPDGRIRIDWIFGSKDVDFTSFAYDRSPLVRRVTDHAALVSSVTIP